MAAAGTVYLMYHELEAEGRAPTHGDPGYVRYVVASDDFERQMEWLSRGGWRGKSLTHALGAAGPQEIVLTFDDGCETDLTIAAPILKRHNFTATFYVTVGYIGKPGYLSAAQVRDLCNLGFDVGCHSMTHAYLAGLPISQLSDEVAFAKIRLQQITGRRVDHFSCPGGRCDWRVVRMATDAGYLSLATSRAAINRPSTNAFALGRVAVMRNTTLENFQRLCRGEGLWRLQARDLASSAAKRILGNSRYDRVRASLLNH